MNTIKILFLLVGMLVSSSVSAQEFCSKFFDNNLDVALTAENNPDNTQFRFKNLSNRQVSFIYMGTAVSIGSNSISQWFSGSYPSSSNLDCNSVKIDGYPITNYEYIYRVYYIKYNQYPTLNYDNCSSIITQRKQIIAEIQRLKQTVPAWFASKYGGLNFMIEQSQMTIDQCTSHLSKSSNDENQNSNQTNLKNTSSQNYNNYDNNTATQNNNNQGVTQADLNDLLERNAQESNRILGLSPTNTNKTTEQVVSEGLWSLADVWVQSRQERLEREEREEERKRIQAENERIEKENRQRIINNRTIIINKFNAKDIPLSSREKASKIYYFIYSFENNNLNQEYGATVYVSNIFEIGTFSDGTRAYTSTVKNEIINLTPFNEVLHGYYYSETEAENIRKSFIEILKNNGVSIINISYKGKPGTKTATTTTNLTQKNESKYGKTININDQNFAPATLNDPKPTEVPKRNIEKATEEEKKKQSKYGKTIKID